ncbi:non-specific lipid-transfer protein AKCS9 [Spatholobus suberectus]|nr:non-specific lipid-transfer protein AKCS9 [Spatholobus suberectus]
MAKSASGVAMCAVVLVALLLIEVGPMAEAVTCTPTELSPCLPAITSSSPPSTTCCQKLKQQKPCLCGYLKNPSLKQYVNSPGAKRVVSACGLAYPSYTYLIAVSRRYEGASLVQVLPCYLVVTSAWSWDIFYELHFKLNKYTRKGC